MVTPASESSGQQGLLATYCILPSTTSEYTHPDQESNVALDLVGAYWYALDCAFKLERK